MKFFALLLITISALIMILLKICFFSYGVKLNQHYLSPWMARLFLRVFGVKIKANLHLPGAPVIYMFNHNSMLDIFIIPALGLKNTRFILTEDLKRYLPIYLCNWSINSLFVPRQKDHERRVAFFKRLSQDLESYTFSIVCSPEGQHEFKEGIGHFNKGVFHLAMASSLPIRCLHIKIPKDKNPFEKYEIKACEIEVSEFAVIDPKVYPETPDILRDHVREVFVKIRP